MYLLMEMLNTLYKIFLSEKKKKERTSRYNYQFTGTTQDREAW